MQDAHSSTRFAATDKRSARVSAKPIGTAIKLVASTCVAGERLAGVPSAVTEQGRA